MKIIGNNNALKNPETKFHTQNLSSVQQRYRGNHNYDDVKSVSRKNITFPETANFSNMFSAFSEKVSFAAEQFIYKPGDNVKYIYIPESAIMSELQILEDGETIEIATFGGNEIAGLPAVFGAPKAVNWTMTLFSGSALKISADIIRQELNRNSIVQTLLFDALRCYISQISQRVVCNAHHTIEMRLCCWLLMMQDRCQRDTFAITQERLANLLGVYRPSVTQAAQHLRRKNIIEYMRGKVSIINRKKLESTACFCYANMDNNYRSDTRC